MTQTGTPPALIRPTAASRTRSPTVRRSDRPSRFAGDRRHTCKITADGIQNDNVLGGRKIEPRASFLSGKQRSYVKTYLLEILNFHTLWRSITIYKFECLFVPEPRRWNAAAERPTEIQKAKRLNSISYGLDYISKVDLCCFAHGRLVTGLWRQRWHSNRNACLYMWLLCESREKQF